MQTFFDTPERTPAEVIEAVHRELAGNILFREMLESFPDPAVLTDVNRHIVAFNKKAKALFAHCGNGRALGERLGEAIRCIHSHEMEAGCGTSRACAECGVAAAIKSTRSGKAQDMQEARITHTIEGREDSLDLRVTATSIALAGGEYTLVAIKDIADEKRRDALERIFFHDILNTAGAVSNIAEMLPDTADPAELTELFAMLNQSGDQLVQEIQAQRDLVRAERGDLTVDHVPVSANHLLRKVYALYAKSEFAKDRKLMLSVLVSDCTIETDEVMLVRSLGNLVKNALEAVPPGATVAISAALTEAGISFKVANQGVIPENVQLQIFQRSFSTKAKKGRGIGTYSVKLLVERFLGGSVAFFSNEARGTVFSIAIPFQHKT